MAKILVIDDDPAVLRTLRTMLEKGGHQAVTAENGLIGIGKLKSDLFAAVICDLFMPVQEGMETIQKIRDMDARIPIVAISGAFVPEGSPLDDARLLGADAALPKPFTYDQLLDTVEDALDRGEA
jgi:CheY-like chemotaxis protein